MHAIEDKTKSRRIKLILNAAYHRCYGNIKKSNKFWVKSYQEKKIEFYEPWLADKNEWVNWALNNGYFDGCYLDRIDNSKGYTPDNLRFTDSFGNSRNRTNTRIKDDFAEAIKILLKHGFSNEFIKKFFNVKDQDIYSMSFRMSSHD